MIVKQTPDPNEPDKVWIVWFEHKGATAQVAILVDQSNAKSKYAFLMNLESKNRKQGEASELLQEINAYCMEKRLTLIVEAEAYDIGPNCLTQLELKHFYQKNGAFWVERRKGEHGGRFLDQLMMGHRRGGKGWDT